VRELVVERNPGELRIAVREQGYTVEIRLDRGGRDRVGEVHLARVLRVEPGIGAFVEIGAAAPAFLPVAAAPPVEGATLAVQVAKEAVAGKGPEVSRAIVLDGGVLALTADRPGVAVSRRLPESLRRRLRTRLLAALGDSETRIGALVRSEAREDDDLESVWSDLLAAWRRIEAQLGARPPLRLWTPPDPAVLLLRRLRPERVVAGDGGGASPRRCG
jgi:Ribonuclease G/E